MAMYGKKNPIVAALLNLILGAIGYFYIGQWIKGIIVLILIIFFSFTIVVSLAIWIFTIVDVYMQANIRKNGGGIDHFTFLGMKSKEPPQVVTPPTPPPPPDY